MTHHRPLFNGSARTPQIGALASSDVSPVAVVVGPLASEAEGAVRRLLRSPGPAVAWVVPPGERTAACHAFGDACGRRLEVYEGSAATPGLGLSLSARSVLDAAVEVFCVATPAEVATGHVWDFAEECPRLRRLHVVPAAVPARSWRWAPAAARRVAAAARFPLRALSAVPRVAAGAAASGATLVGAAAAGLWAWARVVDLDVGAALTREDLERDLWPGVPRPT